MSRTSRRVEFEGAFGDRLAARIELPDDEPIACALFAHCFTCSKDYKSVVRISRTLASRGVAVCRFDFTGLGESQGEFSDTNFSSNLEDLLSAAEFLRRELRGPQLLIGHSLGGAAMLAVARKIPEARAVVTIGAPSDTDHLAETLLRLAPTLEDGGEAEVELSGRAFRIRRQLVEDLASHNMEEYTSKLKMPLLVVHSPDDETLGIEHAERIFSQASHPKSFLAVDGSDHLMARRQEDARFVADALTVWALRYVAEGGAVQRQQPSTSGQGQVVVSGGASGYPTNIEIGRHRLRADEPVGVGGTDTGPNPYGLLLAALGACKVITLRMYADRKGWPLNGSRVALRHSRIHAQDCEECEKEHGKIDRIDVELSLDGDLSVQQARRLQEISERCPVHRTLKSEVIIETTAL